MIALKSTDQGIEILGMRDYKHRNMVKNYIPKHHINFDWNTKRWLVDYSSKDLLVYVLNMINREPYTKKITTHPYKVETKSFKIFYIGGIKQDFNDCARGTLHENGKESWNVIFPESVLNHWSTWGGLAPENKKDNTLYGVLGVGKSALKGEIKASYRKLAKIHHPDLGGNKEEFQKISHAYELLSNPQKKSAYDFGLSIEQKQDTHKKPINSNYDKCGVILAEVENKIGLHFVKKIHQWLPIERGGKILSTRWTKSGLKKEWL